MVQSTDAPKLVEALARDGILCSTRDGSLRVSLHYYNTRADVEAVLDALAGNVFEHTPEATAFRVSALGHETGGLLVVEDDGPGFDPRLLDRGQSGRGGTGLGLDIARAVAERSGGSFDAYLWRFVGGKPIVNRPRPGDEIPARTELSDAVSKDLRGRGFGFVGSTICYAFLQATGVVNDHAATCFRAP